MAVGIDHREPSNFVELHLLERRRGVIVWQTGVHMVAGNLADRDAIGGSAAGCHRDTDVTVRDDAGDAAVIADDRTPAPTLVAKFVAVQRSSNRGGPIMTSLTTVSDVNDPIPPVRYGGRP